MAGLELTTVERGAVIGCLREGDKNNLPARHNDFPVSPASMESIVLLLLSTQGHSQTDKQQIYQKMKNFFSFFRALRNNQIEHLPGDIFHNVSVIGHL